MTAGSGKNWVVSSVYCHGANHASTFAGGACNGFLQTLPRESCSARRLSAIPFRWPKPGGLR